MKNTFAIVFPVVSVLATLLCTILADSFREKRIFRYRLHGEVFLMKIKLYDEILRTVSDFLDNDVIGGAVFPEDKNELFDAIIDKLAEFKSRAYLVGSERIIKGIQAVFTEIEKSESIVNPMERLVGIFIALENLRKVIREEIQAYAHKKPKKVFFSKLYNRRAKKKYKNKASDDVN